MIRSREESTLLTFGFGYHTGVEIAHPNILTGGSLGRMLAVQQYFDGGKAQVYQNPERGKVVLNGLYKGVPITAFNTSEGAGGVSCTWPEIIEACPHRRMNLVRIGTSGSLQPQIAKGDLVVATKIGKQEMASDLVIAQLYDIHDYFDVEIDDHEWQRVMQRVKERYTSKEQFAEALQQRFGNFPEREYVPSTSRAAQCALMSAAKARLLPKQKIHQGPIKTTAEIYASILLDKMRGHTEYATSMESRVLRAYCDWYEIVDDREFAMGTLLRVSDETIKSTRAIEDKTTANNEELEREQTLAGLDALVAMHHARGM